MAELVWDERLMSREEFWRLAGDLTVRPGVRKGLVFLDCAACGQAVLPLGTARTPFGTTVERVAGAVLRHRVSAHDMPLNHRRGTDGGAQPGAAGRDAAGDTARGPRGGVPGFPRDGAAVRRPAAETADRRGERGPAGDDPS